MCARALLLQGAPSSVFADAREQPFVAGAAAEFETHKNDHANHRRTMQAGEAVLGAAAAYVRAAGLSPFLAAVALLMHEQVSKCECLFAPDFALCMLLPCSSEV